MVLQEMRSQAERYAQIFEGEPYLDQKGISQQLDGPEASKEEVYEAADELIDFYDNLLGKDTTEVRDEFKDDILYDMSAGEMLVPRMDKQTAKIFGSGMIAPLTAAAIEPSMAGEVLAASALICEYYNAKGTVSNAEAGYNPFSEKIGVSWDKLPEREAYDTLASELFHRYQHHFDSDTWMEINREDDIPPLTEGLERASKIKALENFEEKEFRGLDWQQLHDMRAGSTAVNGYAQALSETGEVTENDLKELGLTGEKASQAMENVDSAGSKGYDLVTATLLAEENSSGLEVYEDVFEGDFSSLPDFATR